MQHRTHITYPSIHDTPEEHERWRDEKCPFGWHLFEEKLVTLHHPDHTLECDACGLIVQIEAVIVPAQEAPQTSLRQKRRDPEWSRNTRSSTSLSRTN